MSRSSTGAFFVGRVRRSLKHLPTPQTLTGLRSLHHQAETYHTRPSSLVGVTEPLAAWVLDECVRTAGLIQKKAKA